MIGTTEISRSYGEEDQNCRNTTNLGQNTTTLANSIQNAQISGFGQTSQTSSLLAQSSI